MTDVARKSWSSKFLGNSAQAGWIFSSNEDSFWAPDAALYNGAFRGSSDAGDGTVSLQLQGEGVVVPWLGVVADFRQDQGGGHVKSHELWQLWHPLAPHGISYGYGMDGYGLTSRATNSLPLSDAHRGSDLWKRFHWHCERQNE